MIFHLSHDQDHGLQIISTIINGCHGATKLTLHELGQGLVVPSQVLICQADHGMILVVRPENVSEL